jgi:hypothetical protein
MDRKVFDQLNTLIEAFQQHPEAFMHSKYYCYEDCKTLIRRLEIKGTEYDRYVQHVAKRLDI